MSVETDRELLEFAAKAAGISIDKSEANGGGVGNNGFSITGDAMLDWHNNIRWNPLIDDGDALRLAVKLDIFSTPDFFTYRDMERFGRKDDYACAATRRAIVRAAAQIGRAMP